MKTMRTILPSASTALTATALAALTASASASSIFTGGHGDFAVGFHEGEFEFGYHLGEEGDTAIVDGMVVTDREYEADELIVQVTEQLLVAPGTDANLLNGTGTTVGSLIYLISQDSDGISGPILGVGTEELEQPTGVTWSDVTYTLNSSTGPGLFSLFLTDAGVPTFGISEALAIDSFTFPAGGHDERNWAFTQPGTYELNFTAEATRTDMTGSVPFSATETFTFQVIPEPSSALLLAGSALGLLLRRRRC